MIVDPATTIKPKFKKMIPVVKTEELLQINSFVDETKI
jgi:hypothetical protein